MPKAGQALFVWREIAVLPLLRVRAVRDLRAGLLELAYWLSIESGHRGVLLLVDCGLSRDRVDAEVAQARQVLRPNVLDRLSVISLDGNDSLQDRLEEAGLDREAARGIGELLKRDLPTAARGRIPRAALDLVFEHLINAYLLGMGPMTTESIMEMTGFSYPPVAKALDQLGAHIKRHSDRRVELTHFPRKEWQRQLGVYERGKFAQKFTAPPGMARSPDRLLRRLSKRDRSAVAVSGVHAARHYFSDLDLVGAPRLDLCLHMARSSDASELAERLDPALEPTGFDTANPALVIWPVYQAKPLFQGDANDTPRWADPVSCLLALHDARLEAQAQELVAAFERASGAKRHSRRH